jgi:electron transport complex protein RnfB
MDQVYSLLAQHLDTIPNGFPPTESGIELKLLARLFTPEEAKVASVMHMTPEPLDEIAVRAGLDPVTARTLLDAMAAKKLIRRFEDQEQATYRLLRRLLGVLGVDLPLRDVEAARLAEQYYQETRGLSLEHPPASYRVIPVQQAIPAELRIHPYEQASTLLENARSWAVRDCECRVWQNAIGKGCDHPVETCLMFAPWEDFFVDNEIDRVIDKEEALRILYQAEAAGLVHTTMNFGKQPYQICNCCTCSCAVLRGVAEFGIPTAIARSDFHSVVDAAQCDGCGQCTERCPFGALALADEVVTVDLARCVGCGLCAAACPAGALHLERRPAEDCLSIPSDMDDWMAQFLEQRGRT